MNRSNKVLMTVLGLTALLFGTATVRAQAPGSGGGGGGGRGGRNFDPAQFQQQMMERIRTRLEVTNDDEWKVIQERVDKVMQARRESGSMSFGGYSRRGGGPGGGPSAGAPPAAGAPTDNTQRSSRSGFGSVSLPEADALQKSLDAKASDSSLKSELAKLREARKGKETALDKAQEDLRKLLSLRQEAQAVLMGLLK